MKIMQNLTQPHGARRRVLSVLLTLAMVFAVLPAMTLPASAAGGTGTPDYDWYNGHSSPYTISTADELAGLAQIVNGTTGGDPAFDDFSGKIINLADDINLSVYGASYNGGAGWIPIGSTKNSIEFKGIFAGDGHTIFGLYINRTAPVWGSALFGYVKDGTVKNLGIVGASVTSIDDDTAPVVAWIRGGTVSNCYATGCTVSGELSVGGVVAYAYGSTISNCYSTATVSGDYGIGGVVGEIDKSTV
ncbi:MAG: hypothetical protein LBT12_05925, partial [Oscillospiraceae bacterium]|nr:hypothetical protein [Oscillospiraceae bacterium]